MEIVTYVVNGSLTHKDSMGTAESLERGAVQYMSAGTGVRHSEHNIGDTPLRFIQMWFLPAKQGLAPNYGSYCGDVVARRDNWHHMVSDVRQGKGKTPVQIYQDLNIFVSEISAGKELSYELSDGRQAYLLSVEGSATVTAASGVSELVQHDAAEITGPGTVTLKAGAKGSHVVLVEMAKA